MLPPARRPGRAGWPRHSAGVIEPQRKLLGDRIRNRAFAQAIRAAIRPGARVADLGTGTGFLAVLAERAGARSVWACDAHAGVVALAKQVAKDNACRRIRFAVGHSTELAPPERVDVVIAEILGNLAGEEHLVEALVDARRWLAPGGLMIPGRVVQRLCPVVADAPQRAVDVVADADGVKLGAVRAKTLNNVYVRTLDPAHLLQRGEAAQTVDEVAFPGEVTSRRRGLVSWELPAGPVHGLALWWDAELVPGTWLSTSPLAPPTHWEQVYLPCERPLAAQAGDRMEAELSTDTRWDAGCIIGWKLRLLRRGKAVATIAHDNLTGFIG